MGGKPAPRPPNKGTPLSSGLNVAAGLGSWRAGNSSGLDTTEVATRTGGTRPTAPVEEEGEGGRSTHAEQAVLPTSSAEQSREPQAFRTPTCASPACGARL